jgi:GNAT superfamily N-acetyltransferase
MMVGGSLLAIKESSVSELEAEVTFMRLLEEYASESAIAGLPPPAARIEMYKILGASSALRVWGAFFGHGLIGFITVLAPVIPHYSIRVAVCESFFVTPSRRGTGAGLKLLHLAEDYAEEIGSPGLLISAPLGSNLAEVLPRVGYVETNRVFFRKTRNV